MIFAKNATIFSSEISKNAINAKSRKIRIAKNVPTTFEVSWKCEKITRARATHTARINNCMIEIVSGPIENVNPASNPFFIFFGNTAFIIKITNKFLSKLYLKIGKNAKKKSQSAFQIGSLENVRCFYETKTHIRGLFLGLG